MAYTTIDDPSAHFQTITYSGNGASRSITNTGNSDLKPDWVWIKERNNAVSHRIFDSSRGATKRIFSNNADAESTQSNSLTAFNTDGFSLGDGGSVNGGSDTYVAWQWKANGGTTSSNTSGSVTSTVQANTTAGISIVTWTAANGAYTIGHGLGTTPAMVITKDRDTSERNWWTWHQAFGDPASAGGYVALNKNDAKATAVNSIWGTQGLSSTLFGFDASTSQNDAHVGYFFAEKEGYSKFGSYEANNSTNGPFIYTGFKPAWVILKCSGSTGNWFLFDNTRDNSNMVTQAIYVDLAAAENTESNGIDFLSNGIKLRQSGSGGFNHSGTYIFMAFAENPFVDSSGIPVTAR